ncbi:uncharacterized protein TRAVEDRAFT_32656, partial [Trametes versicolor FP-101664 SS1]
MSAPSSPTLGPVAHEKGRTKRRERPPALDIADSKAGSDGDVRYERDAAKDARKQPFLQVVGAEDQHTDAETDGHRPASATSSLDPYYFGVHSPSESPIPPVPSLPKTPEMHSYLHRDPVTPGRDPAAIDRRTLVGVGELATPRWARGARNDDSEFVPQERVEEVQEEEGVDGEGFDDTQEPDHPDSPWTIEAVDGEQDEQDELMDVKPLTRPLRSRRSVADESGGEEILYPRHPHLHADDAPPPPKLPTRPTEALAAAALDSPSDNTSPPSAFAAPANRARKRTSEEFELDDNGALVSKHSSNTTPGAGKDKDKVRRHRSLGVRMPAPVTPKDKVKERRRDTLSLSVRHSRQTSGGGSSSSSHGEPLLSRRMHNSDFSHLPPSPSSSSIQQFLKQGGNTSSSASSPLHAQPHLPHNVAHSLLRGTQEGWSDLDDQTTMEALRKLDGLSSKTARARSSIGGHSRVGSSSRPSTPAKASTTTQWEGIEGGRSSKRSSMHASLSGKEKSRDSAHRQTIGLGLSTDGVVDSDYVVTSGDDMQHGSPPPENSTKKTGTASARSSFTPKRGSSSSGTYA